MSVDSKIIRCTKINQSKVSLKILLFAPANSPHTLKWAESLAERGHRIKIVSRRAPGSEEYPSNVRIYFPKKLKANSWTSLAYCILVGIWNKITWAPHVIHGHFLTSYGNIASLCSRKYIVSVWGNDIYSLSQQVKTVQYKSIGTLNKAKYILSTSKVMAQKTKEFVEKEVHITPFGVDTRVFSPQEARTDNIITIGCVKWLDEKYGITDTLKAFRILVIDKNIPNLRLVLTGGGPKLEFYKGVAEGLGISQYVQFMGHVPFKKIDLVHKQLDIAVYPSIEESFGVSVLESSACGVPVVVSNVGGLPEVVVQNETGLIINPSDPQCIADTLQTLIEDSALRARLGANGRRFVEEKFSWNKCVDLMESIYFKHAFEG